MRSKSKRLRRTHKRVVRETGPTQRLTTPAISIGILTTLLLSAAATASVLLEGNRSISLVATNSPSANPANLKWDFENKLAAIDTDNDGIDDISYTYDALGRRIGRDDGTSQTVFVHQDQQVVADYALGAVPTAAEHNYVYGDYIDEPVVRVGTEGKRYFHRNQQYSVTALTDETGSVTEQYAYDAYGSPTILDGNGSEMIVSAEANRYLYTGREWDEDSGLYYYRARQYDPGAGRFASRDPIGYAAGPSQYEFVSSKPLDYVDPLGLFESLTACNRAIRNKTPESVGIQFPSSCSGAPGRPKLVCGDCSNPDAGGVTTNTGGQTTVKVCWKTANKQSLKSILRHEFTHASDLCNCGGHDLLEDDWGESTANYNEDIACMEIRAYSNDGNCDSRRTDKERRDCVADRAAGSVAKAFGITREEAMRIVNGIMNECYFKKRKWPGTPDNPTPVPTWPPNRPKH